jgi:hypothetical protein
VFLFVLGCAACGSNHSVLVTPAGKIGPLRVDESTRADVIAFAGKPESERRGRYDDYPPFDALGYGCNGRRAATKDGVPGCETVFYLDAKSGRLAILNTGEPRYVESHGVGAGTTTQVAERRLHARVRVGCADSIRLTTRAGFLFLWFYRGHVREVIVHSSHLNPGVLDCVDS